MRSATSAERLIQAHSTYLGWDLTAGRADRLAGAGLRAEHYEQIASWVPTVAGVERLPFDLALEDAKQSGMRWLVAALEFSLDEGAQPQDVLPWVQILAAAPDAEQAWRLHNAISEWKPLDAEWARLPSVVAARAFAAGRTPVEARQHYATGMVNPVTWQTEAAERGYRLPAWVLPPDQGLGWRERWRLRRTGWSAESLAALEGLTRQVLMVPDAGVWTFIGTACARQGFARVRSNLISSAESVAVQGGISVQDGVDWLVGWSTLGWRNDPQKSAAFNDLLWSRNRKQFAAWLGVRPARLMPVAWAAGLSLQEAIAQGAAGALDEEALRTLARLRGYTSPAITA